MAEVTGAQIAGDGKPIVRVDGDTLLLRCTHRSLIKAEELFGSYVGLSMAIRKGPDEDLWTSMSKAIFCMLQYDPSWRHNWEGLLDVLDAPLVPDEYREAVVDVIAEGLPRRAQRMQTTQETPNPPEMQTEPTEDSPGPTSMESRASI